MLVGDLEVFWVCFAVEKKGRLLTTMKGGEVNGCGGRKEREK